MTRTALVFAFRVGRRMVETVQTLLESSIGRVKLYLSGVESDGPMDIRGPITAIVTRTGRMRVGRNVRVNSGERYNIIGRPQRTVFWVSGRLDIGDAVGISATAIICKHRIQIGARTKIGGNSVIYDTDFHSLSWMVRQNPVHDLAAARSAPVVIGDDVFIGAHSTILKGVTIGDHSIIGAGSVVTRDVPPDEVWAGNPARFIRKVPDVARPLSPGPGAEPSR